MIFKVISLFISSSYLFTVVVIIFLYHFQFQRLLPSRDGRQMVLLRLVKDMTNTRVRDEIVFIFIMLLLIGLPESYERKTLKLVQRWV